MKRRNFAVALAAVAGAVLPATAHAWWFLRIPRNLPAREAAQTPTHTPTSTRIPSPTPTPRTTSPDATLGNSSPAQKLPAAFLVFPLVEARASGPKTDTRVELINMSTSPVDLQCFYIGTGTCFEIGFFVSLTAQQPMSWLVSEGTRNFATFTSVPPFEGEGELKCAVLARSRELRDHNVIQGRALLFTEAGQAAGYSAVAFRRLTPGDFTGFISLDGVTYEKCPDKMHFAILSQQSGSDSELVLGLCDEDLLNQAANSVTAALQIINEFEQVFSASVTVTCHTRKPFSRISGTLSKATLGSPTAHLVVRGVQASLIGLVLDRFDAYGLAALSANEPFLEGGRTGFVTFP